MEKVELFGIEVNDRIAFETPEEWYTVRSIKIGAVYISLELEYLNRGFVSKVSTDLNEMVYLVK